MLFTQEVETPLSLLQIHVMDSSFANIVAWFWKKGGALISQVAAQLRQLCMWYAAVIQISTNLCCFGFEWGAWCVAVDGNTPVTRHSYFGSALQKLHSS